MKIQDCFYRVVKEQLVRCSCCLGRTIGIAHHRVNGFLQICLFDVKHVCVYSSSILTATIKGIE